MTWRQVAATFLVIKMPQQDTQDPAITYLRQTLATAQIRVAELQREIADREARIEVLQEAVGNYQKDIMELKHLLSSMEEAMRIKEQYQP